MSKIEANKLDLASTEFNFEKMLQRIVSIINFRMDEKQHKFTIHIDEAIPKTLVGDDQRLGQVLTNLLGNAIKFTPRQGSISLRTRFMGEEDGVCAILFTVTDSGIGISPKQQENLFLSFQQADTDTTRKYGGTGLGLAISKRIVEMMGGTIWVDSEFGKGSVFSFTIRAKRAEGKAAPTSGRNINWKQVRALIVDDDPDILQYFSEVMQEFGLPCDTARGSEEAMGLIEEKGPYSIYFLDWIMPEMDGLALADALHAQSLVHDDAVFIMVSAVDWRSIEDRARESGISKFLSKPLYPSAIADAINEVLGADPRHVESPHPDVSGIFPGRRILLAEDVDINREIVMALLEPTLLEIDCAANGAQAVQMFFKSPGRYDLILMDLQMPEMDGYEATRKIRASEFPRARTVPILAMTANVFREDVEKCIASGMDGHVGKPIDYDELMEKLRLHILT